MAFAQIFVELSIILSRSPLRNKRWGLESVVLVISEVLSSYATQLGESEAVGTGPSRASKMVTDTESDMRVEITSGKVMQNRVRGLVKTRGV